MKRILWRWKSQTEVPFDVAILQKEYESVLVLGDREYDYNPKYVRKDEVEIVEIEGKVCTSVAQWYR